MRSTVIRPHFSIFVLLTSIICSPSLLGGWKAGTAKVQITPENPLWMAGYAARNEPSKGKYGELFAKALALEDDTGKRSVIVTMDVLGFSSAFIEAIADNVSRKTGIPRDRLLFNASHTHAGPALTGVLDIAYDMSPNQVQEVNSYTQQLQRNIVNLIQVALRELFPVKLNYGSTLCKFAVNRRVKTETGFVIGANRRGPVDHKVPVLVVDDDRGRIRAVVFGYSCHCTTLQGDNYNFHGDYAGVAQAWLEERYPGVTALFVTGTAGDANPFPRGTLKLAEEHGKSLALAVNSVLTGPLKEVGGPLKSQLKRVKLGFAESLNVSDLAGRLESEDRYIRKHADFFNRVLKTDGKIPDTYSYPIQVWRFGSDLSLVALAGEVVVDYSIRLRKDLGDTNLWVAGYSNDVPFYVPSRRVLEEGGYEAEDSMIYYGQPGPFKPTVEDIIIRKVQEIYKRLGEK